MESDVENAKEIGTYSFLLGSAIRNEDTDQFLSIYDSILPQGLSEKQVETIKQKAREIADLTEDSFTGLVSKARDFSLAQDRDKMSQRDKKSAHINDYLDNDSDEHCPASESTYYRLGTDCIIDIPSFQEEEKRTDNDSGIYNSSKATTSLCSNSDQEESEGEERAASFDYFPSTTKITPMYHNDYDEAYDVESDKASQNDIESPRSDKSGNKDSDQDFYHGTEMETFRSYSREQDDFETDDDSDEEVKIAPHRKLYTDRRSNNYYTPMKQESTEEYGDISSSTFSFDNSRKALKDNSASSLRGVDESIHFPLNSPTPSRYSNYSRYNNSSSAGVRVEKSMYSRHDDMFSGAGAKDPPFGHGKDQIDKVGNSIRSLISGNLSVDDMPEGRPISQSLDLADDVKKKKKKKRGSKDDLDDKTRRNSDYDENGNPLDRYLQMRGSPKFGSSSVIHKNHYSASSGFPSNLKDFNKYSISGTPISELESSPFHTTHDSSRTEKKVRKKAKKEEKFILSENIENHVGNKAIDELLDFIENDKNGRKTKKNPQSNDIATLSKSEKNNKKNKDKKLSKPILDEKCEIEHIKEEKNEPKIINEETPLIDKEKTEFPNYKTQTVKNDHIDETCDKTESKLTYSITRMGNTTAKNSSDEKSESQEQINECGVKEKEDITLPSLQVEKMVPETKVNTKSTDNLSESIERQTKKEKKANNKLVDKNIHSNKTKTKGGNSKIDNCIMNGMDSIVSIENNSTKLNTHNGNAKHKHMDKSANKDLSTNDLSMNGITATHNKDSTSILKELDLDMVQNEEYRFTDFESLKKEPEFTVVGKKKKKAATAKDVISAKEALIPPKPFRRDERRKGPRSVTPPPSNKLSSNIEGDRTRDLSPSAFPALGSSNQSSFRDARRNSTGDVRMDVQSIIKAQDDSDIESVKSLPASSQGAWGQNSLSPRLPVSYATMAASPKPSGTSLGSSTNDEDTGETNMDLKAANWKGQIKERRHSIGSHPENVKETENSSIKQKYGSQEVLNVCDQEDFPKVGFDSDYIRESSSVMTEKSNTSLNSNVSFIDNPSSNVTNSQLTTSYSKTENSEPAKQMNHDMGNSECSSEKSSESSYKVSNSRRNYNELNGVEKIKSAKQTLNNSKKVKQSVIFMDKRVGQAPQNLGISFFFDSENESGVTNVDCETIQKCSPADLNSNKIPKTSDSNDLRKNSSENITVIENNTVSCNSKENVTDMSRNHILAGKNGVVDRVVNPFVQNKHHPHTEDFIFISDHNQFLDAAPISTDSKLSNSMQQSPVSQPNVNQDNVMLITFGDQLETVSLPKDIQCKIFYRQDSGDASSNQRFNFPEAVRYLNKEWEKALETSRKNPNEVMVYKS